MKNIVPMIRWIKYDKQGYDVSFDEPQVSYDYVKFIEYAHYQDVVDKLKHAELALQFTDKHLLSMDNYSVVSGTRYVVNECLKRIKDEN